MTVRSFLTAAFLLMVPLIGEHAFAKDKLPSVIALFGDSTSSGFNQQFSTIDYDGNARLNYGRPSTTLSKILNDSRRPSLVANVGYGSSPSGPFGDKRPANNGVDRINNDLAEVKALYDGRHYYALIMYGVNDYDDEIPASITGHNNAVMIWRANNLGFTAIVSTILPCDACAQDIDEVNNAIRGQVARAYRAGADVHYVDNYLALRPNWNLLNDDGLHPTNEGYDLVAQNWFDSSLKKLIAADALALEPIVDLVLD